MSAYNDNTLPVNTTAEDDEIYCPECGKNGYLHHSSVVVYERKEDQTATIHEIGPKTTLRPNPSPRRHGIRIRFTCEQHTGAWDLLIFQHKGQSYMEWQVVQPRDYEEERRIHEEAFEPTVEEMFDPMSQEHYIKRLMKVAHGLGPAKSAEMAKELGISSILEVAQPLRRVVVAFAERFAKRNSTAGPLG